MPDLNSVLLVEDNPGDALLVKEYLSERFGDRCRVHEARTLAEAVAALGRASFDVVLLDLGLPDSVGLSAYFDIQAAAPQLPVVILTGLDDEEQAVQALRMGAEDYLAKRHADSVLLVRTMRLAVERKLMAERRKAGEARYLALVEAAEEGILRVTRSGEISYANRRVLGMLGLDGDADGTGTHLPLVGSRIESHVHVLDRLSMTLLLRTPVDKRQTTELRLVRGDSQPCWVIAAASGVPSESGPSSDVLLLLSDVTGRRLAEAELVRLKADMEVKVLERTVSLEASSQEQTAFSRAIAHDLRNPINGIIGLTHLVRQGAGERLNEQESRRLMMVEQAAMSMNETLAALLSLASMCREALKVESLDLSALVGGIAARLSAADPDRRVVWRIAPGVNARGDRVLIGNVLQNLLDNAWKYTGSRPETRIEFGRSVLPDQSVAYYLRDNGVGFDPAEAQARLFMPFQRLATALEFAGHGLGLVGASRIIERHGGRLWAEGEVGQGATFLFTLPSPDARGEHPA
ncbi:MAG: hypothetical protein RIQ60_1824 [Pseudomonadota bacterium]|jgi:signal transduction histidine kinase/DNA-binding NarL/FixJ family response regulator